MTQEMVESLYNQIAGNGLNIDRGWMILERDATDHPKVIRALEYVRSNSENGVLVLDENESQLMAEATGEGSGIKVRRHIIIQLLTFQFITRDAKTRDWRIALTPYGTGYLDSVNKRGFFQKNVIERLIFCDDSWAPETRARDYKDFKVRPFEIVSTLMADLDDKLYLEEMAYFVSKIVDSSRTGAALQLIQSYRALSRQERIALKRRLQSILDSQGADKFGNWRKTNKRNFEFLSMGIEFGLDYSADAEPDTFPLVKSGRTVIPQALEQYVEEIAERDPFDVSEETTRDETEFNSGLEGENIVANMLQEMGFKIRIVTGANLGYDILALKGDAKFLVEIKSAVNSCSPVLTENEYAIAKRYGEVYILAIVEKVFENPRVFLVIDPVGKLGDKIQLKNTKSFTIARSDWITVAQKSRP